MAEAIPVRDHQREIERLALLFADACCRVDRSDFASLWTTDSKSGVAIWEVDPPHGFTRTGSPDELGAMFASGLSRWAGFLQLVHGTIATVNGTAATARTYVSELGQPPGVSGEGYRNVGIYLDDLADTANGWRYVRRRYHYLYLDRAPLPGEFRRPPA